MSSGNLGLIHHRADDVMFGELIAADVIDARLSELATQIDADYDGHELTVVGVLKGAAILTADLARKLHAAVVMDWVAVSSYGGTASSGVVRLSKDTDADISGRHLLVIDDTCDSGLTLSWLTSFLLARHPASLRTLVLLRKPRARQAGIHIDYVGFDIGDDFMAGYATPQP
jgi:hypoxanthine phosphoribosyltransferase